MASRWNTPTTYGQAPTPEGNVISFKKDTGKCDGLPYIEMGSLAALALLQSVAKVEKKLC